VRRPGGVAGGLDEEGELGTDDELRRTIRAGPVGFLHRYHRGLLLPGALMPRRADPERIAAAMEAGTRARLTGELRLLPARADELLELWDGEATVRGLDRHDRRYWDEAWPWLEAHARG
jgi:hypothetical protein